MIAIADYGVGNIFSLKRSLEYIGVNSVLTENPDEFKKADKLILPGVGAFGDAAEKLFDSGFGEVIREEAGRGKPVLGICLGMQLLLDVSHEYGEHRGLSLIKGEVRDMRERITDNSLKIPQMGWNGLVFPDDKEKHPLFNGIEEGVFVYFVHSFAAEVNEDNLIAYTNYGYNVTAAIARDNIMGLQFHPEKSGEVGLKILENFNEL